MVPRGSEPPGNIDSFLSSGAFFHNFFLKVLAFGEMGGHSDGYLSTPHLPAEAAPSSGQPRGSVPGKDRPLPFPGGR